MKLGKCYASDSFPVSGSISVGIHGVLNMTFNTFGTIEKCKLSLKSTRNISDAIFIQDLNNHIKNQLWRRRHQNSSMATMKRIVLICNTCGFY